MHAVQSAVAPVIAAGGGAAAPARRSPLRSQCQPAPAPRTAARRCPIATVAGSGSSTTQAQQFAESYVTEDLVLRTARSLAREVGLDAVTPGAGAALRLLAAAGNARAVVEIGTGTGVSGVWLLRGMRADGVLTTIDVEAEHQRIARRIFAEAGFAAGAYPDHHRPGARRAAPARRRRVRPGLRGRGRRPSFARLRGGRAAAAAPRRRAGAQRRAGRRPDRRPGRPGRGDGDGPRDDQGGPRVASTGSPRCCRSAHGLLAAVKR